MQSSSKRIQFVNIILDKRKLLGVIAKPILLLFLIKIISINTGTFRVFEFPALLIVIGLPLAYLIRDHQKITCHFHWYVTAAAIGLIFVPFIYLIFGFININFVFVYSVQFLYSLALLSCMLLLIVGSDREIEGLGFFTSDKYPDIISVSLISLVVIKFTLKNFSHTFPGWDTFTFWGLDANYIYQFNELRDATFNITGDIHYSSLFPVMYSIVYDFFGRVVEQYATWLNIFILAVGSFQVYFAIGQNKKIAKLLGLSLLVGVMMASESAAFLLYFYSDVYCAFLFLQYALHLTTDFADSGNSYGIRLLLIILPLIALSFVKTGLYTLSLILLAIYIIHDFPYLRKNIRTILGSKIYIPSLLLLVGLILMRMNYLSNFPQALSSSVLVNQNTTIPPVSTMIDYLERVISFFAEKSPVISFLWISQVIGVIFSIITKRINKQGVFVFVIASTGFLFFVGGYVVSQMELVSGSLARYTSIVMFVIILNIGFIDLERGNKNLVRTKQALGYLSVCVMLVFTITGIIDQLPFELSSGSYRDYQLAYYHQIASQILDQTGPDAKILIADDLSDRPNISNMDVPAIFFRYYLMNNSVGGQFQWEASSKILEYATKHSADYILLLSYDDKSFNCGDDIKTGSNYLVELPDIISTNFDICEILSTAATPLD